jgi:hypothetical protein
MGNLRIRHRAIVPQPGLHRQRGDVAIAFAVQGGVAST